MRDDVLLKGRAIRRFFFYWITHGLLKEEEKSEFLGPTQNSARRTTEWYLKSSDDGLITVVVGFFRSVVVHNNNNMLGLATQKPSSFVIVRYTTHVATAHHISRCDATLFFIIKTSRNRRMNIKRWRINTVFRNT